MNQRENDGLILKNIIDVKNSVDDLSTKMTTLEIVIMGIKDAPGLAGVVKLHGEKIETLMCLRYKVAGGVVVVGIILGVLKKYLF